MSSLSAHPPPSSPATPSQLDLSPSKARAHAQQAQKWSLIDSWLARLYTPVAVPTFERNAETIEALWEIFRENERIDGLRREEQEVLEFELKSAGDVQAEEKRDLEGEDVEMVLLRDLEWSLNAEMQMKLAALADTAVRLGYMPPPAIDVGLAQAMGQSIMRATARTFALENRIGEIEGLRGDLEAEMEVTRAAVKELKKGEEEGGTADLVGQTARWVRETKVIAMKLVEYRERIAELKRAGNEERDGLTIEVVREREALLGEKKTEIRALERRLAEFHGLPPDVEASRAELRRAQAELEALKGKRMELFQRIGGE